MKLRSVENFVAGKPDKGCAAILSFVPNWSHSEEEGSTILSLGLSFWKHIPDKQIRWFRGSLTHLILSLPGAGPGGGEETRNLDFLRTCLFSSPLRLPCRACRAAPLLCQISLQMFRGACSGDGSGDSGPRGDPRGIPARCLHLRSFPGFHWTRSFLSLLSKNKIFSSV